MEDLNRVKIEGASSTLCFVCGKVAAYKCKCGEGEYEDHKGRHNIMHFESVRTSDEDLLTPAKSIYEKIDQALEDFDPEKV